MSEVRHDLLLPRWVIIAENRADRPNEFVTPRTERQRGPCPFCPGNESRTPAALLVRRPEAWNGDESEWRVRVVSNLYPAVAEIAGGGDSTAAGSSVLPAGGALFGKSPAAGFHEVVIDTPQHVVSLGDMSEEAAIELFGVYRERTAAMRATGSVASALVFKNVGSAAGASIEHAHSQILATRRPAFELDLEWELARAYYERDGVCAFCRMVEVELASGVRIVDADDVAVALCPFASRFPYEMWIMPRAPMSHFDTSTDGSLAAVAAMTRRVIARLEKVLARPAYNFVVHSAPFDSREAPHYDWHVELYPRLTSWAGFEVGGGCYINPVSPERAAERLRKAAP
jgi:UDPglucose--hexose-1-phosphate uridylyltransferase